MPPPLVNRLVLYRFAAHGAAGHLTVSSSIAGDLAERDARENAHLREQSLVVHRSEDGTRTHSVVPAGDTVNGFRFLVPVTTMLSAPSTVSGRLVPLFLVGVFGEVRTLSARGGVERLLVHDGGTTIADLATPGWRSGFREVQLDTVEGPLRGGLSVSFGLGLTLGHSSSFEFTSAGVVLGRPRVLPPFRDVVDGVRDRVLRRGRP